MIKYQVTCITKPQYPVHQEHIEAIGGSFGNHNEAAAIGYIEAGVCGYFTRANGVVAEVLVKSRNGRKYLSTSPDGVKPNNLLSLPNCP